MASMNKVILIGNLTRDPEVRHIQSGTAVAEVGIAVNDKVKRGEEWVDDVTFVDVTVWGRQAETMAEYCKKGAAVLFEGRLKLDQWEQEGQKRSKLKVVAQRMQMLGNRGASESSGGDGKRSSNRDAYSEPIEKPNPRASSHSDHDDDIPF